MSSGPAGPFAVVLRCAVVALLAPRAAEAMTLDEAIRVALAQNPALAGRIIDVRIADAHTLQAAGLDDFVAAGSATWNQSRGPNVVAQETPLLPYDSVDANASLTRSVGTGATIALKLDAPYVRVATETPAGGTIPAEGYQPSAQLSVTQPLLRGRGYDVARAPIRQAHALRDVAGWTLEDAGSSLARDVAVAYWELAYQAEDSRLREESLAAARAQLAAVRAQIEVGKLPPSASFEVEVSIAEREDVALASSASVVERGALLAGLLGPEVARGFRSLAATEAPLLHAPPDGDLVARAVLRNAAIASLRAQTLAAEVDVDVARSGLLPQLDASLGGGPMGVGADPRTAFRSLATLGGFVIGAGLVFQEPIGLRAQRGARDAALGGVAHARAEVDDALVNVEAQSRVALAQLGSTRERADLLTRAAKTAAMDVESETARFNANRSTSFDVLRRQQALTDVRISLLRAQTDNAEAAAALDALSDDILVRHGLAIAGGRGTP